MSHNQLYSVSSLSLVWGQGPTAHRKHDSQPALQCKFLVSGVGARSHRPLQTCLTISFIYSVVSLSLVWGQGPTTHRKHDSQPALQCKFLVSGVGALQFTVYSVSFLSLVWVQGPTANMTHNQLYSVSFLSLVWVQGPTANMTHNQLYSVSSLSLVWGQGPTAHRPPQTWLTTSFINSVVSLSLVWGQGPTTHRKHDSQPALQFTV